MELTNNLLKKCGWDKLLHLAFGGWFVAVFSIFNIWAGVAAFVVLAVLSVLKEVKFDAAPDWKDLYFALGGGALSLACGALRLLW